MFYIVVHYIGGGTRWSRGGVHSIIVVTKTVGQFTTRDSLLSWLA